MKERPIGISILSVLYILGGLAILVMQLFLSGAISEGMESIGISGLYSLFAIGFLGFLGLSAGIGMWTGKRWGWYLGTFYLLYSVARSTNAILMIPSLVEQFGAPEGGVDKYYIKYGGRIFFHSLLTLYFFKGNVVEFFGVGNTNPWKRFGILFGATVFFLIVMTIISIMSGSDA